MDPSIQWALLRRLGVTDTAENLVWIDLETTGLDPFDGIILEVGCVVTDRYLREIGRRHWVVGNTFLDLWLSGSNWAAQTHAENGLLDEIRDSIAYTIADADSALRTWLDSMFEGDLQPPLCGSSIHFERRWLEQHMPKTYEKLSYRSIDVSSFKEVLKRLRPELAIESQEKNKKHRALDDIRASIDEFGRYVVELGLM